MNTYGLLTNGLRGRIIIGYWETSEVFCLEMTTDIDFRRPLEKYGFWEAVYYIDGFWTAY